MAPVSIIKPPFSVYTVLDGTHLSTVFKVLLLNVCVFELNFGMCASA
jgi:hypothetical protein